MAHYPKTLFSDQQQTNDPDQSDHRAKHSFAWVIPVIILAGFILTAWLLFGKRFMPAREVVISTVVALPSQATVESGGQQADRDPWEAPVLFQASGWIEADPFPIRATALIDGVVEEVFVLEGSHVKEGDLLATLIDDDMRLAFEAAEASLSERRSDLRIAEARLLRLPMLQTPPKSATVETADRLTAYPSVELLVDRARAVSPGWSVPPASWTISWWTVTVP